MEPTFSNITSIATSKPARLDRVARVLLNVTIIRDDGRLAAVGIILTPDGARIDHHGNFAAIVPGDVFATLPAWLRRELEFAALTIA